MFKVLVKRLLVVLLFAATTGVFAQSLMVGNSSNAQNESVLMYQNDNATTIRFSLNEVDLVAVETDYGRAVVVTSGKAPSILEKGCPELFYLTATFIIPDMGSSVLEVSYGAFTEYQDIDVAPSKGHIQRIVDPETVPYVKGEVYEKDGFYPGTFTNLREPFIMRDVRGQSLDIYPVQYNPVTKVLRVYSEIVVTINYTADAGVNEFTTQKRNRTIEAEFDQLYRSMFINHSAVVRTPQHPYVVEEDGEMLIICHPAFKDAMKPYVDWKRTSGRETKLVTTAETGGATVTAIKSYVQNYYNNPNNNLAFILLVGDHEQVPTHTYNSQTGGSPNPAGSDHFYGQLVGNDAYVEVLVGRFSAETVAHVETQVQRTIHHERDVTTADTWLSKGMGLGANEGSGGGHDNGEADYVHMNKIRDRMMTYGYNPVYQEYNGNCPGVPNTSVTQISSRLNSGVSLINYCNHGTQTGWYLQGLDYTSTHVNQLQNVGMLPHIHSVACVNGRFMGSTCFAEAWLRATHNNQPTGAVAVLMATLNLWWVPPMTAQDAFVNICLDLPPYYPTEVAPGTKRTFGGAAINAGMLMMNIHGSNNNNQSKEDFDSWLVFGDPSLMLRTKTPQEMTVTHNPVMFLGMSEFSVICDADNALATMSWVVDNEVIILGTGVVSGGVANITLAEPVAMPGEITLCVTGHNRVTKLSTILATPAAGPYVVASGYSVVGADKLTYISTNTEIEVTLSNVGVQATENLTVTLSCDDAQLTIVEGTATTTGIAADGTAVVKFKVTVSNDIPDNKNFLADVTIAETGKGNTWDGKLSLKAFAPDFTLEKVLVDGVENGSISAGTVATITTVIKNKGGADAYTVKGDLDISSPYIEFACADATAPGQLLPAGETIEIPFVVVTAADMPYGHQANMELQLTAQYERSHTAPFTVSNTGSSSYCAPVYTTGCTSNDKFTQVILYKTSAPSDLLINKLDGACSAGGYENYTNITIPLEPGQQYTIKVKCGFGSQTVKGWFDLNGNNAFDANEQLITLTCTTANTEYTANFTIPNDFNPGTSRFRLRCVYSNTAFDACNSQTYGQVHDYTITLPELYPRVENVVATLHDDHIDVTWDAATGSTPDGYNIYRNGNKLNTALLTAKTFTENNIVNGVYAYNVTAVYAGNKESFAEMSNVICNFLPCVAPVTLDVTVENNNAVLTWEDGGGMAGTFQGYNIFRNNVKINTALVTVKTYTDEDLAAGTYTYQVAAVYDHCESEMTDGVSITILSCEKPVDLAGEAGVGMATLTWNEPENVEGVVLLGYNIYRDGEPINADLVAVSEYIDEGLALGEYLYQVSAVYEHCESLTDGITIEITEVGIAEMQAAAYKIFPNPAHREVNITGDIAPTFVRLYNITGQLVYETTQCTPSMTISVETMPAGVYFIQIDSVTTKLIIK